MGRSMSRRIVVGGVLVVASACVAPIDDAALAIEVEFPPAHPFLADSSWPTSHGSPWSQGSRPHPGPVTSDGAVVEHLELGLVSVTLAVTEPYPDGDRVAWASTPARVARVRLGGTLEIVDSRPSGGGLQDLVAGAYTLLDNEGTFFATAGTSIFAYVDEDPSRSDSLIASGGSWDLPDPMPDETLRGLSITWDGTLVVASSAGRLVALDRDLTQLSEVHVGGEVSNSIALDEHGGVYVVTSEKMWRAQWTGAELSLEPESGAWSASYETGDGSLAGGRLGAGSGSTPSLMTVGDDALVVITDVNPLMRVVAFWRDGIPPEWAAPDGTDPRVAGIAPVTFGDPNLLTSVSEQSVLVMGDGAVVVNNDYGDATGLEPIFEGLAPPGIQKFTWDAEANTLRTAWARADLSCPNGIPSASGSTGLMYCFGRRGPTWTLEALAWDDGSSAFHIPLGDDVTYNSTYAATEIGPDGTILSGTFTGMVRIGVVP
jgi:hypothetical protein